MNNIYHYWVDAQGAIRSTELDVNEDRARIHGIVEISPIEIKLKGKESISALRHFVDALEKSIKSISAGLDELEKCRQMIGEGNASVYDPKELEQRFQQFGEMLDCCKELNNRLRPVMNDNFSPLLEPKLFELLKRLVSFSRGSPSPPIKVTVTYEI